MSIARLRKFRSLSAIVASAILCSLPAMSQAAEEESHKIELAEGKMRLTAPETWQREQPKTRIVDHEFSIPKAEGDEADGRMTVMGAGGSVEQNIDRWIGQFRQPDGSETREHTKTETVKVGDHEVILVDISGTYSDMPGGPFAGGRPVLREDYRMLAAIVRGEGLGQYFFKFYGPKKTVEANAEAFRKMVESLEVDK